MTRRLLLCAFALLTLHGRLLAQALSDDKPSTGLTAKVVREESLAFEENEGQANPDVKFLAHGSGFSMSLSPEGMTLAAQHEQTLTMTFLRANPNAVLEGLDLQEGRVNYFVGSDPTAWKTRIRRFGRVRYKNLYPGIDVVFYAHHGQMEHDFVVAPGADPSVIRLRFSGGATPSLDPNGDLLLTRDKRLRFGAPISYQNLANRKQGIRGRFALRSKGEVAFQLAGYDATKTLIIDPPLLYATYLGGLHDDNATAMAVDVYGNAHILGFAASDNYPVSLDAYQLNRKNPGNYVWNIVVTKISPNGTLLFSTYLGGSTGDWSGKLALDPQGNVYLTGATQSSDFPVTANGYPTGLYGSRRDGPGNGLLAKLSADGSTLLYSTVIPGTLFNPVAANGNFNVAPLPNSDYYVGIGGPSIVLDNMGRAYVAGSSVSTLPAAFPATPGSYMSVPPGDHSSAAFVAIFDLSKSGTNSLVAATYYGANGGMNTANGLVLDAAGNPWITGTTYTNNLPTTADALQPTLPALDPTCRTKTVPSTGALSSAAYVAKLSDDLSGLLYASYLSGQTRNPSGYSANCYEYGQSLSLDAGGHLFVAGVTGSANFPVTAGVPQSVWPGSTGFFKYNNAVGFVSKLSPDGTTLLWSTYLGGNTGFNIVTGVATDAQGNPWVVGGTDGGANFPVSQDAFQSTNRGGFSDGFITELSSAGTAVLYSSYLGGTGFDVLSAASVHPAGNVYVAGSTNSLNPPLTANAFQSKFANGDVGPDGNDVYVAIFGSQRIGDISPASAGNAGDSRITISSSGLQQGLQCFLMGQGTIVQATQVTVSSDGLTAFCNFPLHGAAVGSYDIALTNPDGSSVTKQGGFTVANGFGPDLAIDIVGRSVIRAGTPTAFYINVSNAGDANAYFVFVNLAFPSSLAGSFVFAPQPPYPGQSPIKKTFDIDGSTNVTYLLPIVPGGTTSTFRFDLTSPSTPDPLTLEASIMAYDVQLPDPSSVSIATPLQCFNDFVGIAASAFGPPGCVYGAAFSIFSNAILSAADRQMSGNFAPPSAAEFAGTLFEQAAPNCLGVFGPAGIAAGITYNALSAVADCDPGTFGKTARKIKKAAWRFVTRGSFDPNEKDGAFGDGSASHYVPSTKPLVYQVAFENLPTASLSAAKVVITDQLDPLKFDVSTVTLKTFAFGNTIVSVPLNTKTFSDTHPIDSSLEVRLDGHVNPLTGLLEWNFTSIDPSTHQPPTDPTLGFLPPDLNGVEGQGSVVFSVMPRSNQPTGTQLTNQAEIVFDANAPIPTPLWLNTIDDDKPSSHVLPLPAIQTAESFAVQWSGFDVGAGIAGVDIYVSDNGGPFVLAQSNAPPSMTFAGEVGHTYSFHSIARDGAGNIESSKNAAEATTRVVGATGDTTPPTIVPHVAGVLGLNGWYTSNVVVTWEVADPESGINSAIGCGTATLTADTTGVTLTCAASNGAGLSGSAAVTVKIDRTAPEIAGMPAGACTVWPPNRQFVQVATVTAADAMSGLASFDVTGTSSEPTDTKDIVVTGSGLGPRVVQLRADRLGNGSGRTYSLRAAAIDLAGNEIAVTARCVVPHNAPK